MPLLPLEEPYPLSWTWAGEGCGGEALERPKWYKREALENMNCIMC